MRILALTVISAFAAAPLPASAQEAAADRLAERLADPAFQDEIAGTAAVMSEILLDLPIAPLVEAAAEMTGADAHRIDPDTTLRQLAGPNANRISDEIAQNLPRAMGAAAGMTKGFAAMMPALRAMAERLEDEFENAAPRR